MNTLFRERTEDAIRGMAMGLFVGPLISLFSLIITYASTYNYSHGHLVFLLPIGAVFTYATYQIFGGYQKFTNYAIDDINAIEEEKEIKGTPKGYVKLSPWMGIVNFFNSIISQTLGAAVGKEGVGVQLGISSAVLFDTAERRLFKSSNLECYLMTGASAAFGSLFQSPVAGTLFGLQFASPKNTRLDMFLPCVLASFMGNISSDLIGVHVLTVPNYMPLAISFSNYFRVLIFSLLIGIVTRICCFITDKVREDTKKLFKGNQMMAVIFLSTLLVILSLVVHQAEGTYKYNGMSLNLITLSILGETNILDFLIKFLFILLSLSAGFQGGEVLPLLVLGSTLGGALGPLIGIADAPASALGAIGMLSGGTNLSLVCFALGLELFHYSEPSMLFMAAAASFVLSGKIGIYRGQRL